MLAPNTRTGIIAGFALLASTQMSLALDADDFAKKLVAAYGSGGAKVTYGSASASGDTITLSNVLLDVAGEAQDINMGDIVFDGVKEDGSGGYTAAEATQAEFTIKEDDFSVSMKDIRIDNLYIPADATADSLDGIFYYDRATTGPMTMTIEGQELLKITSTDTKLSKNSDGSGLSFNAVASGLGIDLSNVPDAQAQQAINGMGYQNLSGDMVIKGSWGAESGELSLDEYALTLDDVGRLDIRFSMAGYTLEFIRGMQKLQEDMAGKEGDANAQQAMGFAMLGMMQQLSLNNMSIRFDDASLTNKVLDMVASQQGMGRDQMVQGLQAMLPFVLGQLKNPEFQKTVTEAVSLYLSDPKNIEISANPDSPLPFAQVAGSAMTAPETLPNVLNVKVLANQ